MAVARSVFDLPMTAPGLLPTVDRRKLSARPVRAAREAVGPATGPVLNFRDTGGWGNVGGTWTTGVSTINGTFETWIRTTQTAEQTIFLGSNGSGGLPRISLSGDQISVYWNSGGSAGSWTSQDTTPVTDGLWHHIAIVFTQAKLTFFKDGVATADSIDVLFEMAGGDLQLGAGFGSATGFVGQLYNSRIWSVSRTAQEIAANRWAQLGGSTPGLTVGCQFDEVNQQIVNVVGAAGASISDGNVITTDLPQPSCGFEFTGAEASVNWVNIPAASSTALTLECWISIEAADAGARTQILMLDGARSGATRLEYLGDQKLGFFWLNQSYASADTTVIADGSWHHVAIVFDNNQVRLFKDGVATADQLQLAATLPAGDTMTVGGQQGADGPFKGQISDVRGWAAARTAAEVSSFRYVPLTGQEPGLIFLCTLSASDPADPATWLFPNQVPPYGNGLVQGAVSTVAVDPPSQPLPTQLWQYPLTNVTPIGPVVGTGAVLALDVDDDVTANSALLRSIDPQTGVQLWEYDVRQQSGITAVALPPALTCVNGVVYLGVQDVNAFNTPGQVQAVDAATGSAVWTRPANLPGTPEFMTRPVILNGTLFVGVNEPDGATLVWGDPTTGQLTNSFALPGGIAGFITAPVLDAANIYIGSVTDTLQVTAINLADGHTTSWNTTLTAEIVVDLALGAGLLFVVTAGAVQALNTDDGSTVWTVQLSSAPFHTGPLLVGSTLYLGGSDGIVYALDAATGAEQWRVDTGSPIVTDLINEEGVLYFATQGDGADAPPSFFAVDTLSQGNDVLSLVVPNADTILFAQGGLSNGNVYFYSNQDVYAVNMSNVLREFSVTSKLLVENYDTTAVTRSDGEPTGSDTSYRVSLALRDENGMIRVNQAIKVWSTGTLYITNQSDPLTLTPTSPQWLQTDSSGNLTLAVSAFDNGSPTTGSPNVACPPLLVWADFMAAGEAIVIYPDHESLTSLANVQGATPSDLGAAAAGQYLDTALGYDGQPLIQTAFSDPTSLGNIASAVRNTVGTRNTASVGAPQLAGHTRNRYVTEGVVRNVLYTADSTIDTSRPFVPGSDAVFTADLSSGQALYNTNFDPSSPTGVGATQSIFTHIEDLAGNVLHGLETVAKLAWQFTENAVETVIHTAESVYNLTITSLEDAITVVASFLKSVINDIKRLVQWLSALFNFKNILANHAYIRQAITNPTDPDNPGIIEVLSSWVTSEGNGGTSDLTTVFTAVSGNGSSSLSASGQGAAGTTVGSQQSGGNNDPNSVYNSGGQNNSNQCTFMHQKVMENSSNGSVGNTLSLSPAGSIGDALQTWVDALAAAVKSSFADLPEQISKQFTATLDTFKDPKSLLSTGLSGIMALFEVIADDMIAFGTAVVADTLTFVGTLLDEVGQWLATPISIPFVSDLYHLITGDQLSILDLFCFLAAVPGTILLDVLTGSPTIPADSAVGSAAGSDAAKAGFILLGVGAFVLGQVGCALDILTLEYVSSQPNFYLPVPKPPTPRVLSILDLGSDILAWATGAAADLGLQRYRGKSPTSYQWTNLFFQTTPQLANLAAFLSGSADATSGASQCERDVTWSVITIVASGVFAAVEPSNFRDAPDAPGIVLAANLFNGAQGLSEVLLLLLDPLAWAVEEAIAKFVLFTVGNALNFTSGVLSVLEPS